MSETNRDDTQCEAADDATAASPIWRNVRVVGTAAACLLVFSLATYLMKAMTAGANVTVEADEITTVLMNADGLRLEEIDGPLVLTLRPGNNAVRAGKFRVVGEIGGERLDISTGRTLEIKKDDSVVMKVRSISLNEEP